MFAYFGYLPDLPDPRDYTKDTPAVQNCLNRPQKLHPALICAPIALPSMTKEA
jgi:hypothetical protein